MPRASVCGWCAASPTSCTGDAGTPAATSASSSSAELRSRVRSSSSATSSVRLATRSGFVTKRGSAASSGRARTWQSAAKSLSLPATIISSLPRAVRAERSDRAVDEPRVARPELGGAEAVAFRCSGPQALEEHVGLIDEAQHDLAPSLVAEVDRERALACVRREEHRALPFQKRRPPGARVVAGERLHLDDIGSERREQLRRRRPGEGGGDVDDAHAGEWVELGHRSIE